MIDFNKKLPTDFYSRNVHTVAKDLLGKYFVKNDDGIFLAGKIVEVEAYDGSVDEAAHSFNGKTKRNEMMFKGGGNLYVYFTYGMYFCANIVTGKMNSKAAVLLRAFEPVAGIDEMSVNRFGKKNISEKEKILLTNGPGKICIAFKINKEFNGTCLTQDKIFVCDAPKVKSNLICSSTRIGIKKSVDLPWRYFLKNNPYLSKK